MLFIISSNDTQRLSPSWSWAINEEITSSGETDRNLEELMRLIDDEEIQESEEVEEENVDNTQEQAQENVSDNQESDIVEEDQEETGFFARLFGRDNEDSEANETTSQSWATSWETNDEINIQDDTEESMLEVDTVSTTTSTKNTSNVSNIDYDANIIKSSSQNTAKKYVDENIDLPGISLETAVGNQYQIWVQMLKLNNKNFTQKIALMKKGDIVTQLTPENEFWCFRVNVTSIDKTGYVCKKYLSLVDTSDSENIQVAEVADTSVKTEEEIVPAITTQTWSYYKIAIENTSFFDVVLERFTLDEWDILRQTSLADKDTGCVDMKVVGTSTWQHDGKIVAICSPDMVNTYNY